MTTNVASSILELTSQRLVEDWLADVPAGEHLAPFFQGALLAALDSIYTTYGKRIGTKNAWLRTVFAIPKNLDDNSTVIQISQFIQNAIPVSHVKLGLAIEAEEGVSKVDDTGLGEGDDEQDSFKHILNDLKKNAQTKQLVPRHSGK